MKIEAVLAACLVASAQAAGPSLSTSFRIIGHTISEGEEPLIYIYNFDEIKNRSSIITSSYNVTEIQRKNITIFDHGSSQFVSIVEKQCGVSKSLPNLHQQVLNNQIDLQALARVASSVEGEKNVSRGRSVEVFTEDFDGIPTTISWTDGEVRYPYEVSLTDSKQKTLRIFALGFTPTPITDELEIPDGIYCENYENPANERNLRLDDDGRTSLKFRAEIASRANGLTPKWFEGYFAWRNFNLLSKIAYESSNSTESETVISSMKHEEAFVLRPDVGPQACRRIAADDVDLPENVKIVDPLAIDVVGKDFNFTEVFYGLRHSKIHFKKKVSVRGIPCSMYSVLRKDWPFNKNATTLWEWCFKIDTSDAQVDYPISLHIYPIESNFSDPGMSSSYSFYSTAQKSSLLNEVREFDIAACFNRNQSEQLVFALNVDPQDSDFLFTSDFLIDLRDSIAGASGMPPEDSLRIQKTNVLPIENSVFVEFTLLDKLSEDDNGADLANSKEKIIRNINKGKLIVVHKNLEFNAVRNSLRTQEQFFAEFGNHTTKPVKFHRRLRRSIDDQSERKIVSNTISAYMAYGFASLLFAVGCGVALIEWYFKVHRPSTIRSYQPAAI